MVEARIDCPPQGFMPVNPVPDHQIGLFKQWDSSGNIVQI